LQDVAWRPAHESAGGGKRVEPLLQLDAPGRSALSLPDVGALSPVILPQMGRNALFMCGDALGPAIVPTLIFENLSFVKTRISIFWASGERISRKLPDRSEPFSEKSDHGSNPM
jgi:hypothetical protein